MYDLNKTLGHTIELYGKLVPANAAMADAWASTHDPVISYCEIGDMKITYYFERSGNISYPHYEVVCDGGPLDGDGGHHYTREEAATTYCDLVVRAVAEEAACCKSCGAYTKHQRPLR